MNVGMLWFDNDKERDLSTKVKRAAEYYRKKYGNVPNMCYVHPSMFPVPKEKDPLDKKVMAGNVEIRSAMTVLPNHLWIGENGVN
ncbi:MAG TPA: hypothetical protein PK530_21620 [Anaerolineales bacterium]|nr:hypothetical protein [Anaerolineales bacterium]